MGLCKQEKCVIKLKIKGILSIIVFMAKKTNRSFKEYRYLPSYSTKSRGANNASNIRKSLYKINSVCCHSAPYTYQPYLYHGGLPVCPHRKHKP